MHYVDFCADISIILTFVTHHQSLFFFRLFITWWMIRTSKFALQNRQPALQNHSFDFRKNGHLAGHFDNTDGRGETSFHEAKFQRFFSCRAINFLSHSIAKQATVAEKGHRKNNYIVREILFQNEQNIFMSGPRYTMSGPWLIFTMPVHPFNLWVIIYEHHDNSNPNNWWTRNPLCRDFHDFFAALPYGGALHFI